MSNWKKVMVYRNFVGGETSLNTEINLRNYTAGFPWETASFVYNVVDVTFGSTLSYDVEVQHVRDDTYKFVNKSGNPSGIKIAWVALEVDDFSGTKKRALLSFLKSTWRKRTIVKKHGILLANKDNNYIVDTRTLSPKAFGKMVMVPSIVSVNLPPTIRTLEIRKTEIDEFRCKFKPYTESIVYGPSAGTYFLDKAGTIDTRVFPVSSAIGIKLSNFKMEPSNISTLNVYADGRLEESIPLRDWEDPGTHDIHFSKIATSQIKLVMTGTFKRVDLTYSIKTFEEIDLTDSGYDATLNVICLGGDA